MCVLCLTPFPPGIDYRAWGDEIEGFGLLRWLLFRMTARVPASSLIVLCLSARDYELASVCAEGTGVAVFQSTFESKLEALGDIAMAFRGCEIAWFYPEFAFAPSDLLNRALEHHRVAGNHYTHTVGLPRRMGCEIADGRALAAVGGLPYEGSAPDPLDAFTELARMRQDVEPAARIIAEPFDTPARYPKAAECPEIAVLTCHEADRARRCLEGLPLVYGLEAALKWDETPVRTFLPEFSGGRSARGLRVLYVSDWSGYSGAEECLRGLVEGMAHDGFDQYALIGVEGLLASRLRDAGAHVACTNWPYTEEDEASAELAVRVINEVWPDVIHCNSPAGPALLREAAAASIPIVSHARSASFEGWTETLAQSARVIAVSRFVARRLEASGIPADRVDVVYDGIDTERFRANSLERSVMRTRFDLPDDAFVVLLVARPTQYKRHDLVVEAAALARQNIPQLRVVFVGSYGEPALRRDINNLICIRSLQGRVTWLGFQDDIREIESAADVLVLCSDGEPLGTCVIEAMALERPVVVSDSGGTSELVEDGISGIVVPSGDAEALAHALQRLAASQDLGESLGRCGRQRVLELCTLRAYAERSADVLRVAARLKG